MKRIILISFLLFNFLFAKEDYSEMSTQELIAIIGFVKDENKDSFLKELNSRIPNMSENEKIQYQIRLSGNITKEEQLQDEN